MPTIYQSKYAAYRKSVRPEIPKWEAGVIVDVLPRLVAEFGQTSEYAYPNPEDPDQMITGIETRGHFFFLEEQAAQKGWTPEETELVRIALDRQCKKTPTDVWLYTAPAPAKPWPTYDEMHEAQIAVFAEQLGLIAEAIAYEKHNLKRKDVLKSLSEAQDKAAGLEELTAA